MAIFRKKPSEEDLASKWDRIAKRELGFGNSASSSIRGKHPLSEKINTGQKGIMLPDKGYSDPDAEQAAAERKEANRGLGWRITRWGAAAVASLTALVWGANDIRENGFNSFVRKMPYVNELIYDISIPPSTYFEPDQKKLWKLSQEYGLLPKEISSYISPISRQLYSMGFRAPEENVLWVLATKLDYLHPDRIGIDNIQSFYGGVISSVEGPNGKFDYGNSRFCNNRREYAGLGREETLALLKRDLEIYRLYKVLAYDAKNRVYWAIKDRFPNGVSQ